jgi:hypothetical protein
MKIRTVFASCMFLSIACGAGDVLAAGPAVNSTCHGAAVDSWLGSSHGYAVKAASRLNGLAKLSEKKRESAWNAGDELLWFGAYSESRFKNVQKRISKVAVILDSWRLDVRCKWTKSYYGNASPGIYRITLGGGWKGESAGDVDKPQTFVHEAAHIAGAVLGGEVRDKYGVPDAIKRAKDHPGVAVRTAENLGYYAVCRSSTWSGKGGCPH